MFAFYTLTLADTHIHTHTGTREKICAVSGTSRSARGHPLRFFIRTDHLILLFVAGDPTFGLYSLDSGLRLACVAAPAEAAAIDIFAILDLGDGVPTGTSG